MPETFVTSDLHLGHRAIVRFEATARPFATVEEHDEVLVARWNDTVRPQDTVWVLGDVAFGPKNLEHLRAMNGKKKLVLGNHDVYDIGVYMKYFKSIKAYRVSDNVLFSHIPVHPDQFHRYRGNVHGHLHSKRVMTPLGGRDWRYVNACIEHWDLTPVPLHVVLRPFRT